MSFSRYLKPVKDFPGYTVDCDGRVYNSSGHELCQIRNRSGYLMVKLCRDGYEKNCSVHRLVADAFFDGEHDGYEVNHIDGDKENNFIGNLEYVTKGENLTHAYRHNLRKVSLTHEHQKKGAEATRQTFSRPVIILETGEIFSSIHDCAKKTGCDLSAISKCCNGYFKQHRGFHFAFAD